MEIRAFHRVTLKSRQSIASMPFSWCAKQIGCVGTPAWWFIKDDGVLYTDTFEWDIMGDWDVADHDKLGCTTFLFRHERDAVHFKLVWGDK